MGSSAAPSSNRPPLWYFAVVALLIVGGIAAPLTVGWYERRTASTAPVDTTGNAPSDSIHHRADSVRADRAHAGAPRPAL